MPGHGKDGEKTRAHKQARRSLTAERAGHASMVWTSVTPSYPNRQECMMINTALAHDGEKTEREGKGGRGDVRKCPPTTLIQKERQERKKELKDSNLLPCHRRPLRVLLLLGFPYVCLLLIYSIDR